MASNGAAAQLICGGWGKKMLPKSNTGVFQRVPGLAGVLLALSLKTSKDGESTASLGDLSQGCTILLVKNMDPPLQPVKVLLDGIPSLQSIDHTTQLGVVSNLAEGALDPAVHIADKDVKQCQSQYRPLRNATRHWSPLGYQAVDHNHPANSLSTE
ncbi:hypothetical protein GRJ2_001718300 [Grus japonensis]|uniref:Uncharacterized protein n=1 Tax=Grus japonensis TaxID=30415 RepID=A0ABC9X4G4_GRUJA